jgi:hypothetical protein
VYNHSTQRILCISPYKSLTFDTFQSRHTQIQGDEYIINDAVEGTMINLFYDHELGRWMVATRNSVGGNYWFYRTEYATTLNLQNENDQPPISEKPQKTFLQMMLDALHIDNTSETWYKHPLIEDTLSKEYSYSFVLQHHDNHIVYENKEPRLYLVGIYHIPNTEYSVDEIAYPTKYPEHNPWTTIYEVAKNVTSIDENAFFISPYSELATRIFLEWKHQGVLYLPRRSVPATNMLDIIERVCDRRCGVYPMGLMVTHKLTGERCKIDNPLYLELKELRGNNPNLHYHFFVLLRMGKIRDFTSKFPRYSKVFRRFLDQYISMIDSVHNYYIQYYVLHQRTQIPKNYFVHVSKIHHDYYLKTIQTNPKYKVSYRVVCSYFEKMEPHQLLYIMGGQHKK